jgi:hypothetical protein
MENQELINEYLSSLSKIVTDLTLENILLKARVVVSKKEKTDLLDQSQKNLTDIKELKEMLNATRELKSSEDKESFAAAGEVKDYIVRLEAGLEEANTIIARLEEEKNQLVSKLKEKTIIASELELRKSKDESYTQNIKLLKELEQSDKIISDLKKKLKVITKEGDNT